MKIKNDPDYIMISCDGGKSKNLITLLIIVSLVVLFFLITIIRMDITA